MKKPSPFQARILYLLIHGCQAYVNNPMRGKRRAVIEPMDEVLEGSRYTSSSPYNDWIKEWTNDRRRIPPGSLKSMLSKGLLEEYDETVNPEHHRSYTRRMVRPTDRAIHWVDHEAVPKDFEKRKRKPRRKPPLNAVEIIDLLKDRHSGEAWAFFRNFIAGTGRNANREWDAFAVGLWPSNSYRRIVYEVKVRRGDFLKELKDPDKRARAMKFAEQYFFAAPAGLIDPDELPDGIGLIEAHTYPKKPPKLRVKVQAEVTETPPLPMWLIVAVLRRIKRAEEDYELQRRARPLAMAFPYFQHLIDTDAPASSFKSSVKYWLGRRGEINPKVVKRYLERYNSLQSKQKGN